jgi:hypothetical protein
MTRSRWKHRFQLLMVLFAVAMLSRVLYQKEVRVCHFVDPERLAYLQMREQKLKEALTINQAEISSQISVFERELSGKYQNERLHLQLIVQNSTDLGRVANAEARLSQISKQIEKVKTGKRQELETVYTVHRAEVMLRVGWEKVRMELEKPS